MVEASSSGGESSEEEEHDEATLSLSGSVSPITADSQLHTNKKQLHYFRDYVYLQRLPEHRHRRIQEEIGKGHKPGEIHCRSSYVDSK